MSIFALVDCNNFYASCERVFNPFLDNKPVIILSNNDGCIIARSNEAKKLGIPMGAPFHEWRALCDKKILFAFSSNYALYGDMSQRVMISLQYFCSNIEVYSIDEAFLALTDFPKKDLNHYAILIKKNIKQWTGIPISIGLGPTKTLAKIANYFAKKKTKSGIFNLCDPILREKVLQQFPIEDIWGIGRQLATRLKNLNIYTAADLRNANLKMLRMHFSVVMEKMIEELRGTSCLPLEAVQPRKQIMSSRSFGKLVTSLTKLEEALSHYAAIAGLKLRKQNCVTGGIYVFLNTNFFREKDFQYANSATYYFPDSTCNSSDIIHAAKICLRKIFRSGFRYQKIGIMLLDLSPQYIKQLSLLETSATKNDLIMQTMDKINEKIGKDTIFICAEGIHRNWKTRCFYRTHRYTTQWNELVKVKI